MAITSEIIESVKEQMGLRAASNCSNCKNSFVDNYGYMKCGVNPTIPFFVDDSAVCNLYNKRASDES